MKYYKVKIILHLEQVIKSVMSYQPAYFLISRKA